MSKEAKNCIQIETCDGDVALLICINNINDFSFEISSVSDMPLGIYNITEYQVKELIDWLAVAVRRKDL